MCNVYHVSKDFATIYIIYGIKEIGVNMLFSYKLNLVIFVSLILLDYNLMYFLILESASNPQNWLLVDQIELDMHP